MPDAEPVRIALVDPTPDAAAWGSDRSITVEPREPEHHGAQVAAVLEADTEYGGAVAYLDEAGAIALAAALRAQVWRARDAEDPEAFAVLLERLGLPGADPEFVHRYLHDVDLHALVYVVTDLAEAVTLAADTLQGATCALTDRGLRRAWGGNRRRVIDLANRLWRPSGP